MSPSPKVVESYSTERLNKASWTIAKIMHWRLGSLRDLQ